MVVLLGEDKFKFSEAKSAKIESEGLRERHSVDGHESCFSNEATLVL